MTTLERLTAYLCRTPGTEALDDFHTVVAQRFLDQHAYELADILDAAANPTSERGTGVKWAADKLRSLAGERP